MMSSNFLEFLSLGSMFRAVLVQFKDLLIYLYLKLSKQKKNADSSVFSFC